jgi:dienelactone hydrolase
MIRTGSVRLGAAAALLALTLLALAWPWARAAAFVVRAAGLSEQATGPSAAAVGLLTALADQPFLVQPLSLAGATGEIPARVYRPERRRGRTLIVVGGVNREGIDEPRLVKFAGDLAAAGIPVVTPELAALTEYRLTPTVTDDLEGIVAQVATRADLTGDSPVGLMGVSFAGGLSVVAAGRASVRDKVAYVLSFGGHGDLERVLRYLCTGLQPDRELRPPHDYGLAVMLLNLADRVVPPEQVDGLRRGIDEFLRASQLDMSDRARAADVFAEARRMEATLDEPARRGAAALRG